MKNTIEKLRINKGYTQMQMADKMGIAVSTYNQYVSGKRKIPVEIKENICRILDIPNESKDEFFLPASFTLSKIPITNAS